MGKPKCDKKHVRVECSLISCQTGSVYKFRSMIEASVFLGRSSSYITRCAQFDRPISSTTGESYRLVIGETIELKDFVTYSSTKYIPTKCWECSKYAGGCSWTKSFLPVCGWDAIPTKIKTAEKTADSFIVLECPEFMAG